RGHGIFLLVFGLRTELYNLNRSLSQEAKMSLQQSGQMSIGEVANRVGVRTSAVRFYERRGLLPAPQRINGRRRYDSDVIQQIRLIQLAQRAGFTVKEIRVLLYDFPAETPPSVRWQKLSSPKLDEVNALLARVTAMKTLLERTLECQCPTLETCASGINESHKDACREG